VKLSPKKATVSLGVGFAIATLGGATAAQTPPPGDSSAPATVQPPAAFPPSLQAGGLTPPLVTAPTTPPVVPNQTEKDLENSKKEDSKRGLEWFWINAGGGFSQVDLKTFAVDNKDFTLGFVRSQATGAVVDAGLGVRLLFITLGARGRIGFYDPWQMFTVGGELGLHLPIGRLDPHFELGGGYAALGSVNGLVKGASDAISIAGGYGRLSGGIDVYVTPVFSIGVTASGDFLAMVRPGLTAAQIQTIQDDKTLTKAQREDANQLKDPGASYGTAFGASGVLGLHF
jgi:hypothetical protein